MRILIIEDEKELSDIIKRGLVEESHAVDTACTGNDGQALAESTLYDLVILDVILPGRDGFEVCRNLRQHGLTTPILMLTCRSSIADKVMGLDAGADDYLVKPFAFEELFARVRALLRRETGRAKSTRLCVGNVSLDPSTRLVKRGDARIDLNPKEFAILEYLMWHAGAVVTRTMIEQHTWNMEFNGTSNVVDVYIKRLRRKLDCDNDELIQTVRGVGYRFIQADVK